MLSNYQPGQHSERVITSGSHHVIDPNTRFAIPNERELKRAKRQAGPSSFTRAISFTVDGTKVTCASNLPFTAPGLQWNGGPSISSRQLEDQREKMIGKRKQNASAN